jgi:hypothetical protein
MESEEAAMKGADEERKIQKKFDKAQKTFARVVEAFDAKRL